MPQIIPHLSGSVRAEELKRVPYLTHIPTDDRSISLQPFFDANDNSWKMYFPHKTELTLTPALSVEGPYFSERIVDPEHDIYLKLLDIVDRHFSYQTAMDIRFQIMSRLIYSAVVVEKYFLSLIRFRNMNDPTDMRTSDLVVTDLEYLFANTRIVYDLIQELISFLWKRERGITMKDSFRAVVQQSGDDLRIKYQLPDPMISYYASSKDLFFKIRAIRDGIFHFKEQGPPQRFIICYPDGFAVLKSSVLSDPITHGFDIWPQEKIKPYGLVSVLALISYVNKMILENSDLLSDALVRSIRLPTALRESYKLYIRSAYLHHLLKADKYIQEQWVTGDVESRLSY